MVNLREHSDAFLKVDVKTGISEQGYSLSPARLLSWARASSRHVIGTALNCRCISWQQLCPLRSRPSLVQPCRQSLLGLNNIPFLSPPETHQTKCGSLVFPLSSSSWQLVLYRLPRPGASMMLLCPCQARRLARATRRRELRQTSSQPNCASANGMPPDFLLPNLSPPQSLSAPKIPSMSS